MAAPGAGHVESLEHVPAGERGGGFPPFDKTTFASQLLWLAIFFIALYGLTTRVAQPLLGGIIKARSQRIADDLAEAERKREASDAPLASYKKALAAARERAQTVANETRDRLNAEAEKSRHNVEAKLNAKLAEAEKTIAATKTA